MADRLGEVTAAGVAIWLDDLSRARLATGSPANSCLTGKPSRGRANGTTGAAWW